MERSWLAVAAAVTAAGLVLSGGGIWAAEAASLVPCYFIFGDSLVDNGNNNAITSLAKANYYPYGIDFPGGATGRFTNGRTTVDVIASQLGFDSYIPPYATARGRDLLRGVNFASAAAGIRDETGRQLGGRVSMSGQVRNFRNATEQLAALLGNRTAAAAYLRQCVFTAGMGSNDYLNNYFMPSYYSTSRQYTPEQFAGVLVQQYEQQLREVYGYGARKVAVIGVGQIGCSPNELALRSRDGRTCVEEINRANRMFNDRLRSMVEDLNRNLGGARFVYLDVYGIFQDILSSPASYGIRVTNTGCCGVGRNRGLITCLPGQRPCSNRREHLFWDAFHTAEAANVVLGGRAFRAQKSSDAYPYDIQRLAQLRL